MQLIVASEIFIMMSIQPKDERYNQWILYRPITDHIFLMTTSHYL
jgi:hypothetical protein